jgi:hypothetical protein
VVIFAQMLYNVWAEAEKKLSGLHRLASLAGRALFKVPAHGLLPRVLPKLDPWLGSNVVCNAYMVAATRSAGPATAPP